MEARQRDPDRRQCTYGATMKSAETLAFNVARLMRVRRLKQRSLRGVSQTNMRRVLATG